MKKILLMMMIMVLMSPSSIYGALTEEQEARLQKIQEEKEIQKRSKHQTDIVEILKKEGIDVYKGYDLFYSADTQYGFATIEEGKQETYMIRMMDKKIFFLPFTIHSGAGDIGISPDGKFVYFHDGVAARLQIYSKDYKLFDLKNESRFLFSSSYKPILYIYDIEKGMVIETINFLEKGIQCDKSLVIDAISHWGDVVLACRYPSSKNIDIYHYNILSKELIYLDKLKIDSLFGYSSMSLSKNLSLLFIDNDLFLQKDYNFLGYISKKMTYLNFTGEYSYDLISHEDEYFGKKKSFELPKDLKQIFSDVDVTDILYRVTRNAWEKGWLTGYNNGKVELWGEVNRAEFGKMEMLAFGMGEGKEETLKRFPDTTITEWYTPYVSKAVELGIMKGYGDGKMKPENNITVAEGVKMTIETMKQKRPELFTTQNFPTISSFSLNLTPRLSSQNTPWYTEYMEQAKTLFENIEFLNHPDLDPNRSLTRGECIELISVGLEKMGD